MVELKSRAGGCSYDYNIKRIIAEYLNEMGMLSSQGACAKTEDIELHIIGGGDIIEGIYRLPNTK